eukprot:sb/3472375/
MSPSVVLLLLLTALPSNLQAEYIPTCVDYNGTTIDPFMDYYKTPCDKCECMGEPEPPTTSPVIKESITLAVSFVGVGAAVVLMVGLYLYRRRLTSYVRQTRRLAALERDHHEMDVRRRSSSAETDMDAPPPAYNELTVKTTQLPPRYEDVLEDPDLRSPSAPPNVED